MKNIRELNCILLIGRYRPHYESRGWRGLPVLDLFNFRSPLASKAAEIEVSDQIARKEWSSIFEANRRAEF